MRIALAALLALSASCLGECSGVGGIANDVTFGGAWGDARPGVDDAEEVDAGPGAPLVPGTASFIARESGPSNLSTTLTINSVSETPDFYYCASAAGTTWAGTGDTLTLGGTGTAPTTGVRAPAADGERAIEGAVATGANAQSYRGSTAVGDTNSNDGVVEVFVRRCNPGANGVFATTAASGMGSEGVTIIQESGNTTFSIHDGTSEVFDRSDTAALSAHGTWTPYHMFWDHGDATGAQLYKAGTIVSTSVSAATWGSIDGTHLTIGGAPDSDTEGLDDECALVCIGQWSGAGWFAGGATNTTQWSEIARQRTALLSGLLVRDDEDNDYAPTTLARGSTESCPIYDATAGDVRLFNLADGFPCVSNMHSVENGWGRGGATELFLAHSFHGITNLVADIASNLAGWTNVASTDADDAHAGPYGDATAGEIIGDGTDAFHGLSTPETLTASRYTKSWFVKQVGSQTYAYADDTTIANVSAYFDLTTCTEGTVGSAATAWTERFGNGWCRVSVSFTGTAAAHTLRIGCAVADGDNTSTIATACLIVDMAQVELSDVMTSFHEPTTARGTGHRIFYGDDGVFPGETGEARFVVARPYSAITGGTTVVMAATSDGTLNNNLRFPLGGTNHRAQSAADVATVATIATTALDNNESASSVMTQGEVNYIVNSWSTSYASTTAQGYLYGVDTSVASTLPTSTLTTIAFGSRVSSAYQQFRGGIGRVDFYDTQRANTVVIYGDSLTRATPYVSDGEEAYKILAESVKADHRTYAAFGVGGDSCDEVSARFACTGPIDTAIIWCGTNDIATLLDDAAEVQADLEGIIATADACGVGVILVTITPRGLASGPEAERQAVNTWIRSQAAVAPVYAVVDADALLGDGVDLDALYDSGDNLHLNAAGQAVVADAYAGAVVW